MSKNRKHPSISHFLLNRIQFPFELTILFWKMKNPGKQIVWNCKIANPKYNFDFPIFFDQSEFSFNLTIFFKKSGKAKKRENSKHKKLLRSSIYRLFKNKINVRECNFKFYFITFTKQKSSSCLFKSAIRFF